MPNVYPCLCGYQPESFAQMRRHCRQCLTWAERPDPKGLAQQRRAKHQVSSIQKCVICGRGSGKHAAGCQNSLDEKVRLALLERYGIDPAWFQLLLRVLQKRY